MKHTPVHDKSNKIYLENYLLASLPVTFGKILKRLIFLFVKRYFLFSRTNFSKAKETGNRGLSRESTLVIFAWNANCWLIDLKLERHSRYLEYFWNNLECRCHIQIESEWIFWKTTWYCVKFLKKGTQRLILSGHVFSSAHRIYAQLIF